MNTNSTKFDSRRFPIERKPADSDKKEQTIERAIVIGAVLILILVAVVYYVRFADPSQPTDGYSTSTLQPITRY